MSVTESAAEVSIGRIQVGALSGGSAQVITPVCCVPVACAGIAPKAPPSTSVDGALLPCPLLPPPPPPLLQAASAVVADRHSTAARTSPGLLIEVSFLSGVIG